MLEELELIGFRGQEGDVTVPFLKNRFTIVINNELCRMLVSLEAKFFSDEA